MISGPKGIRGEGYLPEVGMQDMGTQGVDNFDSLMPGNPTPGHTLGHVKRRIVEFQLARKDSDVYVSFLIGDGKL